METVESRAEKRVLLRNISWETYERLLEERGDSRVPRLAIFELRGEEYVGVAGSKILPPLTGEILSSFVEESPSMGIVTWMRRVREWVRDNAEPSD